MGIAALCRHCPAANRAGLAFVSPVILQSNPIMPLYSLATVFSLDQNRELSIQIRPEWVHNTESEREQ